MLHKNSHTKLKTNNNDINFKIKLQLRQRGRRAEAEKKHCRGQLQPDCLQRVPSRLEKFSS